MFVEFKDIAKQKISAARHQFMGRYPDVFTKMYNFTRANTARALGYYPYYPGIEESDATEVTMNGERKIMLGSNNYLGLTQHPEIIEAGTQALRKFGSGLTGSRLLNGNILLHDQLEAELAEFVGKEKALVFSTGYGVNLGVIATVVDMTDLIVSDELNHASIVDGSRFSRAQVVRYKHNDMDDLRRCLSKANPQQARFLVSDGVFSMEGDMVKLPEWIEAAKTFGARTMIDEAHALGVLGPHGEGVCGHFGCADQVDLVMGTFSKSLGGVGGFIAGESVVIDYLKHHTRTMIFTAALPPSNVAMVRKALEIIRREPERRRNVMDNAAYVNHELRSMGYNTGNSETPVIPVIIGKDMKTFFMWKDLLKNGVYTNPVVAPAVPKGRSLLRTSYMATHTREQLDYCLEQFRTIGKKHGAI